MIDSIAGSAAGLHYLSASLDEHMGHVRQNLQQANINAGSVRDRADLNAKTIIPSLTGVTQIAASSSSTTGASGLNLLPVAVPSLHVGEAGIHMRKPGYFVPRSSDNPYEKDTSEHEDHSDESASSGDQALAELIEIQAMRTVVETSLMVQQENLCTDFLVAVVFVNPSFIDYASISFRQMTVVAPLDQDGQQISAHTTFLSCNIEGARKTKNLPGQLLWGRRTYASDWMAIRWVKEQPGISETLWRLQANVFQDELVGVGIVNGDTPEFDRDRADISFHIPGIARLWMS
jgi:hypothetical protein